MKQIMFKKDDVICREGEIGSCMYCIRKGSVAVFSNYGTEQARKLAELNEGDFFGEMELIENEPRSATVVVLSDGTLLDEITEDTFLDYFEQDPVKVFMILQQLSQRRRKTTKDYLEVCHALCDVTDPSRPYFMIDGNMDPLFVIPRYWDTDAVYNVDTVRQIGKEARDYLYSIRETEVEYYDIVCKPIMGEL